MEQKNMGQKPIQKIKNLIKKHKKLSILAFVILFFAISGGIFWAISMPKTEPEKEVIVKKPAQKKPAQKYYSRLSGVEIKNESEQNWAVVGAMVENAPGARPQSGLKDSGVVFEAVAEAGITRFLALYQTESPGLIGPIRSVRDYYVDWAGGFNSSLAHVGGSDTALARMRDGTRRDMDQFFNETTFWRTTDRWAPHNVYTNSENLRKLNDLRGWKTSDFDGFARKDKSSSTETNATQIAINFSSAQYNTNYAYNSECNCYPRSVGGEPANDREKGQISPANIIAMKVEMRLMSDGYHNQIQTFGSGEAVVFQDGKAIAGTWEKANEQAQLVFKNQSGKIIALNRGQTWISAVPNRTGSISWQ